MIIHIFFGKIKRGHPVADTMSATEYIEMFTYMLSYKKFATNNTTTAKITINMQATNRKDKLYRKIRVFS